MNFRKKGVFSRNSRVHLHQNSLKFTKNVHFSLWKNCFILKSRLFLLKSDPKIKFDEFLNKKLINFEQNSYPKSHEVSFQSQSLNPKSRSFKIPKLTDIVIFDSKISRNSMRWSIVSDHKLQTRK